MEPLLRYIYDNYPKAFRKLGLENAEPLGSGSYGEVLAVKGYALKFSRQKVEVKAAQRLQGKRFKHLVRVYDVRKVGRYYVIKQQILQPVAYEVGNVVLRMGEILDTRWHLKRHPGLLALTYFNHWSSHFDFNNGEVNKELVYYISEALCEAFMDLSSQGIIGYKDLHGENVMQDGRGTLKLIDFGLTRVPGKFQDPLEM